MSNAAGGKSPGEARMYRRLGDSPSFSPIGRDAHSD